MALTSLCCHLVTSINQNSLGIFGTQASRKPSVKEPFSGSAGRVCVFKQHIINSIVLSFGQKLITRHLHMPRAYIRQSFSYSDNPQHLYNSSSDSWSRLCHYNLLVIISFLIYLAQFIEHKTKWIPLKYSFAPFK